MRTGFLAVAHVVVQCDGCGDRYSETRCAQMCFTSADEAIAYITGRGAGIGWVYDGDKVRCDGCLASVRCLEHGHVFPESRRRLLGSKPDSRTCSVCGISETEIEG